MGAALNQHNIDELVVFINCLHRLIFFMNIAVKKIDLKELKEFNVVGDKIELHQSLQKQLQKKKHETEHQSLYIKKMQSLSFLAKAVIK